jgi:predicted dehydrogenase
MQEEVITGVKTKLAFVGTGWIGLNRMKALMDEGISDTVAIYDTDLKNARKAAELAPDARVLKDYDDLLETGPGGIVIATPSAMHAEQCIKALHRGIPVFCQKPLARNAEETRTVISAAYVANRHLGVDMSYRYTDGMQKIYNKYRNDLGRIFAVDLVFNNAYGPDKQWFYNKKLSGGGCLLDLGVHLVDLALWVLGFPEISTVSSAVFMKGKLMDTEKDFTEDYATAQLITSDDILIRLVCSWTLHAGQDADIRASFHGTRGSALFYNVDGSFYDFETVIARGTKREVVSTPPDNWGGKAVVSWARELQESKLFRESSFMYYNTAEVIDRIYRRDITSKPVWG